MARPRRVAQAVRLLAALVAVGGGLASPSEQPAEVGRLQRYLRAPSVHPAPDYAAAKAAVVAAAEELGLPPVRAHVLEGGKEALLLTVPGTGEGSVLLNSHLDVVPVVEERWSRAPFGAELSDDGWVYARGVQDMKSVGMQYLEALARLAQGGWAPRRDVHVLFVPDEEVGGRDGMARVVQTDWFRALRVSAALDEGWATPGDEYAGFVGERAPWWVVLRSDGQPGHGAQLYDGSAMENMQAALARVYAWRAEQFARVKAGEARLGDVVSVNVAYLRGGEPGVINVQPATAEAGLDVRIPPTFDRAELERVIAEEWAPASANMTHEFVLQDVRHAPLLRTTDLLWRALERALSGAGLRAFQDIFPAATDSRYLRELGVPVLGFSPQRRTPRLLHEHDERLHVDTYLEGIDVYARLIREIADHDGPLAPSDAPRPPGRDEL